MGTRARSKAEVLRSIGSRIAELRRALGLTQQALAERIDMDARDFARIEQARQNVTIGTLVRVAEALGVDVADLVVHAPGAAAPTGRPRRAP